MNWSGMVNKGWYGAVLLDSYCHIVRTPFGKYDYWKLFPVRVSTLKHREELNRRKRQAQSDLIAKRKRTGARECP